MITIRELSHNYTASCAMSLNMCNEAFFAAIQYHFGGKGVEIETWEDSDPEEGFWGQITKIKIKNTKTGVVTTYDLEKDQYISKHKSGYRLPDPNPEEGDEDWDDNTKEFAKV